MNSSFAQVNMFANGGFESGSINTYWTNVTSWTASRATNGMLVADASVAYEGTNYISIEAKGGTSVYLQQNAAASAGTVYEMDGYLMTPAGANQFNPENAYVALTVKFYGSSGKVGEWSTTDIGNGILTTNWVKFTTAPLVAPTGTTNIQAYIVYMRGVPADTTTVGHVYVDSVRLFESAPKQSGGVKNCDFETKPYGYGPNADFIYWNQQYGDAFGVTTNAARTGESALQIWWTGQGLQQSWAATGGVRYTAGGYIMTPSWEPLTSTSAIALIYIEYLNAAGTVLSQATSDHFTTNAAKDVWTYMSASAVAPVGTVSGRTTCCVVMDDANFSGSVFFDDITMSESASTQTVAGKLYNPGFEDGTTGNAYELGDNLPNWEWAGGTNAGFIVTDEALDGYQSYQVVFPNNMLYQWFDATPGQSYVIGGYMRHPLGGLVEGDNGVTDTTAFASILCEFYNADGDVATTSVSVVSTPKLTYQTPTDTWIYYAVTNHAPYGGACSGKVYASYLDLDTNSIVVGSVFFDSFSVVETNITKTDYQAGALWNPGFEYSANGTKLQYIDSWEGLGFDGAIDDSFCRSGGQALKIFYVETLAAQYWDANAGWRYSTEGYVASPSGEFALNGSTGSYAMVIIQYLNETGGVLASYASDAFWATNYTPDTWTKLTAEGRAPSGTVTGRTLCALLGNDDAFSGAVWFDDMTQTVVSTGGTTQAGELVNPGFEDGDGGNAYDLYISDNLPNWEWIGGTNAGFIVDTDAHSGYQSMQIVFPNNLAAQRFDATAGMSYIVDGYMMTPSVGGVTDETAYATFLLEFFDARGDVITSSVSVVSTALLDYQSPKDTWMHFSVTNHAPWSTPCSGRVVCAYLDLDPSSVVVGSVFFDSVSVIATNIPIDANTNSGGVWNPGFEYSADGTKFLYIDNWENLGFDGLIDSSYTRTGSRALKITYPETLLATYWDATPGHKYETGAWVSSPSGDDNFTTSTNCQALMLMQFFDATGTNILLTYLSDPYDGTATPDVWSNLSIIGVAPVGAVSGRTVCAVLGYDEAFAGAVWFDDVSHALLATNPSTAGMLSNPGFDDGIPGNAFDLATDGSMFGWQWFGGDDAGYIVHDYYYDGHQSFLMTWPANYVVQDFTCQSGGTYIAEGYMYTPNALKFSSDGSSYGEVVLSFYVDGAADPDVGSMVHSEPFTAESAADVWTYFCITGQAPAHAIVTGRVSCTIYSDDPEADWELGGVICYDGLSVTEVGGVSAWEAWQTDNFGSTSGPNTGPTDDYDGDAYDNWSEFIAGTSPTNNTSFLSIAGISQSSGTETVISWPSVAGRYYALKVATNLLAGEFTLVANNIVATPAENVYTATPPANVARYFYKIEVKTNLFE